MAWWQIVRYPDGEVVADRIDGKDRAKAAASQRNAALSSADRAAGVRFEVVAGHSPYGVRDRRIVGRRSLRSR